MSKAKPKAKPGAVAWCWLLYLLQQRSRLTPAGVLHGSERQHRGPEDYRPTDKRCRPAGAGCLTDLSQRRMAKAPSFFDGSHLHQLPDGRRGRRAGSGQIADTRTKLEHVARKLDNPKFLSGAKPEVVEEQRARDAEYRDILRKLEELKREYGESA